jgi:PadR family transcriptional regulator, regulatory protein PadR
MGGSDLFTGTLDILTLQAVVAGPLHGYAIGRRLRDRSDGVLDVEEGALYPALHRLQGQGYLASSWGPSETGRRAKFYRLTASGSRYLEDRVRRWRELSGAVDAVLGKAAS